MNRDKIGNTMAMSRLHEITMRLDNLAPFGNQWKTMRTMDYIKNATGRMTTAPELS